MVGLKKSSICLAYQKRRLRGDLITVYRNLHGENIQDTKGLFNLLENKKSQWPNARQIQMRNQTRFLTGKVIKHWHKLQ